MLYQSRFHHPDVSLPDEAGCWQFYLHSIFLGFECFHFLLFSDSNSPRSFRAEGHISRSRNNAVGLATGYGLGVLSSSLSRGQDISRFSETSKPIMGPTQPHVQCVSADFPRVDGGMEEVA